MKRYVFLTNSIRNMGGAQMYMRNKMTFLRKHGWTPTVYFYNDGIILIPELKEFERNRIIELGYSISVFRKKKVHKIVEKIASDLNDAEECVFESHVYHMGYWAEEIARRLNGRSVLYFLHEGFPAYNSNEERFMLFKLDRGEFMNPTKSIEILLGKKWENEKGFIMPSYSNVTAPLDYNIDYNRSYKSILSLGRLDKPYIIPMLKEIVEFTIKTEEKVNLFFIGGAAEESYISSIKSFLQDKELIIPYFLGYMFPVPENIIKAADVAIASSGSVLVPTENGVPTIAIDTQDYMAMGIYGINTENTFTRTTEPLLKVSDLLISVLKEGKYRDIKAKPSSASLDAEVILQSHLEIIESLDTPKVYYDVYNIYSKKEIAKQQVKKIAYQIFGENLGLKISKILRKFI